MLIPQGRLAKNSFMAAGISALFALFVYLLSMANQVTFIDCGELATVASTLGIAHPTGYPLYTVLGRVFSLLPLDERTLIRLNILSALAASGSTFIFYFVIREIFHQFSTQSNRHKLLPISMLLAMGGVFLLGFSFTFWSQATVIEVYSLHLFFVSAILYTFFRAMTSKNLNRFSILFAYLLGLSFTNHMTTVLLIPGLVGYYFSARGFSWKSWRDGLVLLIPFTIGLSVYVYLPLRAAQEPLLNWGNPQDWPHFLRHVSGKQYQIWMALSSEIAVKQLRLFLSLSWREFTPIPIVLIPAGIWWLYHNSQKFLILTLIFFISTLAYSINYDIHDIDAYFLTAFIMMTIWIIMGIAQIYLWLSLKSRPANMVYYLSALVICLLPFFSHMTDISQDDNTFVRNYVRNVLHSTAENGLILSYQWDYFVSPFLYMQHVDGERTDVAVIDKELLRRSWYFGYLAHYCPWLVSSSQAEISAFRQELIKFENDQPYHPQIIQTRFEQMILKFIRVALEKGYPVYITPEIEPEFTRGLAKIPHGLVYRLVPERDFVNPPQPNDFWLKDFKPENFKNWRLTTAARAITIKMFFETAQYSAEFDKNQMAKEYLQCILEIDPENSLATTLLKQ